MRRGSRALLNISCTWMCTWTWKGKECGFRPWVQHDNALRLCGVGCCMSVRLYGLPSPLEHQLRSGLGHCVIITYLFSERGEGREKERERNIHVWLPLMRPLLGTWPTTQACTLTGNRTGNPLVCRPALHSLSHTS